MGLHILFPAPIPLVGGEIYNSSDSLITSGTILALDYLIKHRYRLELMANRNFRLPGGNFLRLGLIACRGVYSYLC